MIIEFIRPICLANTSEPDYVKQIVTLIGVGLTQPSGIIQVY
jgi:hypothetical protein